MSLTVHEIALEALVGALSSILVGAPSAQPYRSISNMCSTTRSTSRRGKSGLTEGVHDAVERVKDGQAAMSIQIAKIDSPSLKAAATDTVRSTAYNRCAGAMVIVSRRNGAKATRR